MTEFKDRLLTRSEGVKRVREVIGIPMGLSAFEKAGWRGSGPKPVAKYGKNLLYREKEVLAWARTLLKPVEDGD
jgi:hypothetical protein